jgi:hypothetical protein
MKRQDDLAFRTKHLFAELLAWAEDKKKQGISTSAGWWQRWK